MTINNENEFNLGYAALPELSQPRLCWAAGWFRRKLASFLQTTEKGSLHIRLPDGSMVTGCGSFTGTEATIVLHRWRALLRIFIAGDIGLAEAYRKGEWSTPDLTAVMLLGIENELAWKKGLIAAKPLRLLLRIFHLINDNTEKGSKRNISFHYDLGNSFYASWLDSNMVYSSALYNEKNDTLEAAQKNKLSRVIELLDLPDPPSAPMKVLEIGCGWGALACAIATQKSANVTGITLSKEQLSHAKSRAKHANVSSQVDIKLEDYRHTLGRFDRLVSIEMIEAVGERYWSSYFKMIKDRLAEGGVAIIQAITISDKHFDHYRSKVDFIQRFIFPGGMLLSPAILLEEASRAGLKCVTEETFGLSYARTLVDWRMRFSAAWPRISTQGFDANFARLWEYYLCYCEAGFRSGKIDVGLYRLEHTEVRSTKPS